MGVAYIAAKVDLLYVLLLSCACYAAPTFRNVDSSFRHTRSFCVRFTLHLFFCVCVCVCVCVLGGMCIATVRGCVVRRSRQNLFQDPEYKKCVLAYDSDRDAFRRDAADAWKKLIELGCDGILCEESTPAPAERKHRIW
jgi:hypothetical protein